MNTRVLVWATGLTLLSFGSAHAQTSRPERPYRGLFGGGVGDAEQLLTASAQLGGGYDDNVLLDQPGLTNNDPRAAQSGTVGSFGGSLGYTLNRSRVGVGASVGTSLRYYPTLEQRRFVSGHNGSIGTSFRLGPRTTLTANESLVYQPYSFTSTFPTLGDAGFGGDTPALGTLTPVALDQATAETSYLSSSTNVTFGHTISRRVALNAGYLYQTSETAFSNGSFTQQGGLAGVHVSMTRSLGLRLGYGYREASYSQNGRRLINQNIDAGLDFSRALSFSRRTSVQFSSGSTAVSDGDRTTFQATGSARLNHEVGRTWLATVAYDRAYQFIDTILAPVSYDSVNAGFGGLINRRLQFNSGVRASVGSVGSRSSGSDFDTYLANAGVSLAVTRNLSVGGDYSYYRYRFDSAVVLPPGVAHNIDRQSVRGYVSLWAPLFNRSRRQNASR